MQEHILVMVITFSYRKFITQKRDLRMKTSRADCYSAHYILENLFLEFCSNRYSVCRTDCKSMNFCTRSPEICPFVDMILNQSDLNYTYLYHLTDLPCFYIDGIKHLVLALAQRP
ncbi:hypothetical protein GOODEAATRI_006456 [Goodea atripinnis]|uniref:Uncharacterized protein n=1 Tax=Goodea atripinnis TaxID=208336 RepID=A0ABV0PLK3_9TELE